MLVRGLKVNFRGRASPGRGISQSTRWPDWKYCKFYKYFAPKCGGKMVGAIRRILKIIIVNQL